MIYLLGDYLVFLTIYQLHGGSFHISELHTENPNIVLELQYVFVSLSYYWISLIFQGIYHPVNTKFKLYVKIVFKKIIK